jgi:hypothetical protein
MAIPLHDVRRSGVGAVIENRCRHGADNEFCDLHRGVTFPAVAPRVTDIQPAVVDPRLGLHSIKQVSALPALLLTEPPIGFVLVIVLRCWRYQSRALGTEVIEAAT